MILLVSPHFLILVQNPYVLLILDYDTNRSPLKIGAKNDYHRYKQKRPPLGYTGLLAAEDFVF